MKIFHAITFLINLFAFSQLISRTKLVSGTENGKNEASILPLKALRRSGGSYGSNNYNFDGSDGDYESDSNSDEDDYHYHNDYNVKHRNIADYGNAMRNRHHGYWQNNPSPNPRGCTPIPTPVPTPIPTQRATNSPIPSSVVATTESPDTCSGKAIADLLKLLEDGSKQLLNFPKNPIFIQALIVTLEGISKQLQQLQQTFNGSNILEAATIPPSMAATSTRLNWGGNFEFSTENIVRPKTVAEVQQIVQKASKIRVLGSRHSFSRIADSETELLSLENLNAILGIEKSDPRPYVKVQAGATYTDLCPFLDSQGFALENLASLSEITVGGAIQTGSHGSGVNFGGLATQVRSLHLVLANGSLVEFGQNDDELKAVVVGLGVFGVITQVDLFVVPSFKVIAYPYILLPLSQLYLHFDELQTLGNNCDLLNTYEIPTLTIPPGIWSAVLITVRADNDTIANQTNLFGAPRFTGQLTPRFDQPPNSYVEQNVEQPWFTGLVGTRFNQTGANGQEIQSEYYVPYSHRIEAIQSMVALTPILMPYAYFIAVRTVKADNFWLSETSGGPEPFVAIHFTWRLSSKNMLPTILPIIELVLERFQARPHWGKVFTMSPTVFLPLYPKLNEFKQLAEKLDPEHKFRNEFVDENLFATI